MTWYDAIRYCNKLSRKNGRKPAYQIKSGKVTWNRRADGYRLLTEAEWEYAARAGKDTISDLSKELPEAYIGEAFEFYYGGGSSLSSNLSIWLNRNKIIA